MRNRLHALCPYFAMFPESFVAEHVEALTEPGSWVFDPFAGSNTTGEACEREGRRWIAVETEERYLEASRFRFAGDLQALPDLYESADDGEGVVVQGSLFG